VRDVLDYPKPGIVFKDITPLLGEPDAFRATVDALAEPYAATPVDKVIGIEARGFVFAAALAYKLKCGLLMLRKPGKLPGERVGVDYELEYGTDRLEMHADACGEGMRVVLIDDLIATGGTALAAVQLLRSVGAVIDIAAFVIDLPDLGGADKLREAGVTVRHLIAFEGD